MALGVIGILALFLVFVAVTVLAAVAWSDRRRRDDA